MRAFTPEERERRREYARQYRLAGRSRKRSKEETQEANARFRDAKPKSYILSRAKNRAKTIGIPFDITVDDFDIPQFCPVFPWLELKFSKGSTRPDNCPSLDRVQSELGYVKGNVRIISMKANRIKSNASVDEIAAIHQYMKDHIEWNTRSLP